MNTTLLLAASSGWEDATVVDVVAIVGVEVITAVAFFFAGAMVGSFLNVVLYRVPLRKNLLWPPSSCPVCNRRLAMGDNVPVLGYLSLRGRCRYCKTPIPPGYLGVEVLVGLVGLAMLYLLVHTGGLNLPLRSVDHYGGALWTIWYPRPDLLSIYAYFCLLAFFLLCVALFAHGGERLPGTVVAVAVVLGAGLPFWQPHLTQVPAGGRDAPAQPIAGLIGVVAGALLGAALGLLGPRRATRASQTRWALPAALDLSAVVALAGAWMGWQAAVAVGVLTAFGLAVAPRLPPVTIAVVCVGVQFGLWRVLAEWVPWWPGPDTPGGVMAGWVVLALGLMGLTRRARRESAPLALAAGQGPAVSASGTGAAGLAAPAE